jgi:hypothetical protein
MCRSNTTGDHCLAIVQSHWKMTAFLLDYKSTNTNKSYFPSFNRWGASFSSFLFFIKDHGYSHLPSDPKRSALYVAHLFNNHMTFNRVFLINWFTVSPFGWILKWLNKWILVGSGKNILQYMSPLHSINSYVNEIWRTWPVQFLIQTLCFII